MKKGNDETLAALEAAVGLADISLVVRSAGVIAEVQGPLKLRRGEWLTIGEEGGSHVHLKPEDIRCIRFNEPSDGNASLEIFGSDNIVLCRVVFRKTNPARSETYDRERAERVKVRLTRHFHTLDALGPSSHTQRRQGTTGEADKAPGSASCVGVSYSMRSRSYGTDFLLCTHEQCDSGVLGTRGTWSSLREGQAGSARRRPKET